MLAQKNFWGVQEIVLIECVSAEIPPYPDTTHDTDEELQEQKREQSRKLRALVLKNMVHGPCGNESGASHRVGTKRRVYTSFKIVSWSA